MKHGLSLLFAVASSPLAWAQNFTVSPGDFASLNGNRAFTFNPSMRLQHIHGDQRANIMVLQGLTLRRFAGFGATPMPARMIDAELALADADLTTATTNFATNYRSQPFVVIPRTWLQLPDLTQTLGSPEPWTVQLPFVVPYVYVGGIDFLWDLTIHSSSLPASYLVDGCAPVPYNAAGPRQTGAGCRTSGNSLVTSFTGAAYAFLSAQRFDLGWSGHHLPASAAVAILIGVQNPSAVVPGLCAGVFVLPLLQLTTVASPVGYFQTPQLQFAYDSALAGMPVYAQAAALDAGQPGIPLVLTPGVELLLPRMPPAPVPGLTLVTPNSGALTGTSAAISPIVRWTH